MKKDIINNYILICKLLKEGEINSIVKNVDINLLQEKFIFYSSDYELYVMLRLILYLFSNNDNIIYQHATLIHDIIIDKKVFNQIEMYYLIKKIDIATFIVLMSKMDYYSNMIEKRYLSFINNFDYNNILS